MFYEIKVNDYGYQLMKDFLNDYKNLEISWNYTLTANSGDTFNKRSSSNPIIIDDIKNLPIYEENIDFIYGDNGIYHSVDGKNVNGHNCTFNLYSQNNTDKLNNYSIEINGIMPKNIITKIDDTNINPNSGFPTASFTTLWKSIYINNKNNSICIYIFSLRAKYDNDEIIKYPVSAEVNFNNIQISPRVT
ncbi:hypothetical protein [Spiroplasma ixodetis]|uniref:hypothetical protein n=1 Tax=Spiroplasma ixodetis TaxID=2141 RepID=UPI0025776DEE|nr:hypothetical protein [Spiroplasma ixodetis]WJG69930.1 hypothetical protein SIXOD_v1c09240 [Spiroplasma ixodetis Y32]